MKRICCSLLLALTLAAPAGADAPLAIHAPSAIPAAATVPAPPAGVSYPLVFQDGRPVLKSYDYKGIKLVPALDTGNPASIELTKELYGKCVAADDQAAWPDGAHCLLLSALGSGRPRQMPVDNLEDTALTDDTDGPASGMNCIFPLDMVDGNCVVFLISQSRLWVGDRLPEPVSEVKINSIPYVEWMTGILIPVKSRRHIAYVELDTGSDETLFYQPILRQEPGLFGAAQEHYEGNFIGSSMTGSLRRLRHSLTLLGTDKQNDDVKIPRGAYTVAREKMDDGSPLASGNTPYDRPDRPAMNVVGDLGMDVLGKYDFALLRREKLLVVWDPKYTPALFPPAK